MATFKYISSKNADYGAAEQYLTFEHDEFTMKPTLDKNGQIVPKTGYLISSLNCGDEDFAIACMRSNLKYSKNQKREDVIMRFRNDGFKNVVGTVDTVYCRKFEQAEEPEMKSLFEELDGTYH